MTLKEAALRRAGFLTLGAAVVNPPVWVAAIWFPLGWLAVTLLVFGSTALGFVLLGHAIWALGGDRSSSYRAAYLGARRSVSGGARPIGASEVYLLWGRSFKRRVQLRRIYALEREVGLDRESPFTADYMEARS